jgi:hypothetical protein
LFCGYGLISIAIKYEKLAAKFLSIYSILICFFWQPFGYAYFNEAYTLVGKSNSFDQDYWGLSALPALKYVQKQNPHSLKIWCNTESAEHNSLLLPPDKRKNLAFVKNRNEADYIIWMQRNGMHIDAGKNLIYSLAPAKDTLVWVIKNK